MRAAARRGRRLATLALVVAAMAIVGTVPTVAQTTVTQQVPFTVWTNEGQVALDGLGSWVATANDPVAGAGQAPADYVYWHEFGFTGSPDAFGHVSMETSEGAKFVSLIVVEETEDRIHIVRKAFDWQANRFYFPMVSRVADGLWAGWIYDQTAATWTFIGGVVVPAALGRLLPESATGVAWVGPDLESCAAYPRADLFRMSAIGLVGQTAVGSVQSDQVVEPGDCPATIASEPPGWNHYQLGVEGSAAAAQAAGSSSEDRPDVQERRFLSGR